MRSSGFMVLVSASRMFRALYRSLLSLHYQLESFVWATPSSLTCVLLIFAVCSKCKPHNMQCIARHITIWPDARLGVAGALFHLEVQSGLQKDAVFIPFPSSIARNSPMTGQRWSLLSPELPDARSTCCLCLCLIYLLVLTQ